jgi:sugar phosphate isomerase/epimerase
MIQKAVELWGRKVTTDPALEAMRALDADEITLIWVAMVWGSFGFSEPSALAEIKPYIIHVHGKYYSIVDGDEPNLRYEEVVKTLLDIGYTGWMSSEFEGGGEVDSFEIVKAHQTMVKGYMDKYLK